MTWIHTYKPYMQVVKEAGGKNRHEHSMYGDEEDDDYVGGERRGGVFDGLGSL